MNAVTLCAFAIAAACAVRLLRQFKNDMGTLLAAAAGVGMLIALTAALAPLIEYIGTLSRQAGLESYFPVLLKSLGTALICSATCDVCKDCGEAGIASKVELAGKICILLYSLPIVRGLAEMAAELLYAVRKRNEHTNGDGL